MLALPADEVHLWFLRADDGDGAELGPALGMLSAEERVRHDRYLMEKSRREFLLTRLLVKTTLARYVDQAPEAIRFAISEHGRPSMADPALAWLRFNLSNTTGLIACAVVRDREIGVDVEWIDRAAETVEIADRFFSPREVADLRALPEEQQRDRFFDYWTLKEAYIKARGLGLQIPLDEFSFLLAPPGPSEAPIAIAFDPRLGDDPTRWRFQHLALGPRHKTALAVEARSEESLRLVITRTSASTLLL